MFFCLGRQSSTVVGVAGFVEGSLVGLRLNDNGLHYSLRSLPYQHLA